LAQRADTISDGATTQQIALTEAQREGLTVSGPVSIPGAAPAPLPASEALDFLRRPEVLAKFADYAEDPTDANALRIIGLFAASPSAGTSDTAEPDMLAVCEALGFDPTNHHNAAKCPYCAPFTRPQAAPSPLDAQWVESAMELIERYANLDRTVNSGTAFREALRAHLNTALGEQR
jgi:hypothetical protein